MTKKYEITIVGDTNDADYITQVESISEEDLEIIKPLIKAIKNFKPYKIGYKCSWDSNKTGYWTHDHNYPYGECLRDDLGEKTPRELYDFDEKVFELFEEYAPYGEYGIHTIESITICPLQKKIKLL
ncbi:hypothetical protein LCGC14_2107600 [marine sediment metagenome]|uniref:Uncharacterized protein n=1 Tax=marine sediment metagenome TaxID=412755 RepID=A0A0F9H4C2_9ZZZZ